MTFDLNSIVRANIQRLKPYSSARSEFTGEAEVFLDANENAFASPAGDGYNRYPDPLQQAIKRKLSEISGVDPAQIFIGNGSDEAIDLLFRIFCEPGADSCIICPPTYGMYEVSADINDVATIKVPLTSSFQLDVGGVLSAVTSDTKLIFICSPNNPTGNLMDRRDVIEIAKNFEGIVVVDEAYIHFSSAESMTSELPNHPNLVVLQTFSKAWAMAGLRVGLAFASEQIIGLMNRVKPPYNVSGIAQNAVLQAIVENRIADWVEQTVTERTRLAGGLDKLSIVEKVYPTDANFLLAKTVDADAVYRYLIGKRIVVRDRSNVRLCEGCLRITVGTPAENARLLEALQGYSTTNP